MKYLFLLTTVITCFLITSCAISKKQPTQYTTATEDTRDNGTIQFKRQRVIASWYGSDFHGRPTASGEKFNMYDFTCAHKEFPFGTILSVTNPRNYKSIKCTITDRGPFIPGRDLDLSLITAQKIGIIGIGVSVADIEVIGRDERYIKTVRGQIITDKMTIQIGSFKDEVDAIRLKARLDLRYKDVYIIDVIIKDVKIYLVRIGAI